MLTKYIFRNCPPFIVECDTMKDCDKSAFQITGLKKIDLIRRWIVRIQLNLGEE